MDQCCYVLVRGRRNSSRSKSELPPFLMKRSSLQTKESKLQYTASVLRAMLSMVIAVLGGMVYSFPLIWSVVSVLSVHLGIAGA